MSISVIVIPVIVGLTVATQQETVWANVCPDPEVSYCRDLGKDAYNATGSRVLRNVRLGKIIGVAWRPRGSVVSLPGFPVRTSPRNAYYYIIDDGAGSAKAFLRQAREIAPRESGPPSLTHKWSAHGRPRSVSKCVGRFGGCLRCVVATPGPQFHKGTKEGRRMPGREA